MTEHRRKFSPQFKAEAVQMVISSGGPIAEIARDLGIHDGTLWVPRSSSTSRDQAVFVDHATDASLSSNAEPAEVDCLG
jgi:transposase-like protein